MGLIKKIIMISLNCLRVYTIAGCQYRAGIICSILQCTLQGPRKIRPPRISIFYFTA